MKQQKTNFLSKRYEAGFSLNFWLKRDSNINKDNIFFYLGLANKNRFSIEYDGQSIIFNQVLNRINSQNILYLKNNYISQPLIVENGSWFNLMITFTRERPLTYCEFENDYIPKPIVIQDQLDYENLIPATQKGILRYFINGVPLSSFEIEETTFIDDEINLAIANDFNGEVGLISIYKRPLSVPEIISNYSTYKNIYIL